MTRARRAASTDFRDKRPLWTRTGRIANQSWASQHAEVAIFIFTVAMMLLTVWQQRQAEGG
jgi:hypothetical protein